MPKPVWSCDVMGETWQKPAGTSIPPPNSVFVADLDAADHSFDAFITVDRNLVYQQNLAMRQIRVIVLRAVSNKIEDLAPLAPLVLAALAQAQPGTITVVH